MFDADRDRMECHRIVVLAGWQKDAGFSGDVDDRGRGHDQRLLMPFDRKAHARVHAGLETEVRVGNFDFHLRRARRRIQNRRHARHAAVEGFAGKRIHFHFGVHPGGDPAQIFFDHVHDEPHDANVDDRNE